ncbi:MAG: SDR family oxidoreductase [Candidatus Omnitrophota bacterium]|jgi:nucleoside-diphosphate-sugar epimerase
MKILLLGGCGYIGTMLTRALLDAGHMVRVVDIMWFGNYLPEHKNLTVIKEDIRNPEKIPMDNIDAIIHLANVANDPCGELNSKVAWEVNVLSTMRLVERAIQHKVKQFIYASSGSVYGVKDEPEVTEELPLVPISDYNKTKMVSERVLMSYQDRILVQCVRPATVCGYSPRMRLDLSVNMLAIQALANGKITVLGGNQTRPNIHIKDMVAVYMYFLKMGKKLRGVYNAGFENISILDIARKIVNYVPAEIIISESNDPRSYRLCSKKLLAAGFKQGHSVDEAIKELVNEFRNGNLKNEDKCYNIKTMKGLSFS